MEKEEVKGKAAELGDSIRSSYARKTLFQEDNTSDYVDNTNVLQREKDERISDLKNSNGHSQENQWAKAACDYFGNSKVISCWLNRKRRDGGNLGITVHLSFLALYT